MTCHSGICLLECDNFFLLWTISVVAANKKTLSFNCRRSVGVEYEVWNMRVLVDVMQKKLQEVRFLHFQWKLYQFGAGDIVRVVDCIYRYIFFASRFGCVKLTCAAFEFSPGSHKLRRIVEWWTLYATIKWIVICRSSGEDVNRTNFICFQRWNTIQIKCAGNNVTWR